MGRVRRTNGALVTGLALLGGLVTLALAAAGVVDPYRTEIGGLRPDGMPFGAFSPGHLFGTDLLGRDMLARVTAGGRVTLEIAVLANILSVGIGTVAGLMAGFYRGWVENVIMRVTDVFLSVPTVLSGLALAAIIGTNVLGLVVIITALYWAWTCRVVFGETLSLRRRTFVEAAIAAGVPGRTIVRRHLLPNLTSIILALAALNGAAVVGVGAGLSYLGAGIQPPTPEWGNMLAEGQDAVDYAPHLLLVPLAFIVITVTAFVLIGAGLARRNDGQPVWSWLDI